MSAQRVYTPEYAPVREFKLEPKKSNKPFFNKKAKMKTIMLVGVIGILIIMAVALTAFAGYLSYENSNLIKQNDKIASEIKDIEIEMQSAVNIGTVEKTAIKKLGMVYPVGSQYVKVRNNVDVDNFAAALKKEAFN